MAIPNLFIKPPFGKHYKNQILHIIRLWHLYVRLGKIIYQNPIVIWPVCIIHCSIDYWNCGIRADAGINTSFWRFVDGGPLSEKQSINLVEHLPQSSISPNCSALEHLQSINGACSSLSIEHLAQSLSINLFEGVLSLGSLVVEPRLDCC